MPYDEGEHMKKTDVHRCKYDRNRGAMVFYQNDAEHYWLSLEDCKTSASLLDFIFQVVRKPWATPEFMGNMLKQIQKLIRPQEPYAAVDDRGPIDVKAVIRAQAKATKDPSKMIRRIN
jgi:hypothetical protein